MLGKLTILASQDRDLHFLPLEFGSRALRFYDSISRTLNKCSFYFFIVFTKVSARVFLKVQFPCSVHRSHSLLLILAVFWTAGLLFGLPFYLPVLRVLCHKLAFTTGSRPIQFPGCVAAVQLADTWILAHPLVFIDFSGTWFLPIPSPSSLTLGASLLLNQPTHTFLGLQPPQCWTGFKQG